MQIYFDHASTTATDPEVLQAMLPYFSEHYANPESRHSLGVQAKIALNQARNTVAKIFDASAREIIFTGSATEANNLSILGAARANKERGTHLVTTEIEHSSVYKCFKQLEQEGFQVTYLQPDKKGFISPEQLNKAINPETTFCSIIYAQNEFGTVQDIASLGEICQKKNIIFHTDACQAAGSLSLSSKELNADIIVVNGSKIYGPKGVGAFYINSDLIKSKQISPQIFGGSQEQSIRPGTHNIPSIIGITKALEIAQKKAQENNKRIGTLRDSLITQLLEKLPQAQINGHYSPKDYKKRLANNINISIPGIDADELLLHLDNAGIYVSTGSACDSQEKSPSRALKSLGLSEDLISSTIRLSLGKTNNEEHINYAAQKIPEIALRMR